MKEMEKITKKLCSTCKYRGGTDQKISCNYMTCTGRSRIFQDGKMAYDPKYCDKYEKGETDTSYRDINIVPQQAKDEYWDYKCVKIRKEQSTYAYKNR
jgi:hypothetical protein